MLIIREMVYQIKLEKFEGPLDLLLKFIEEKKLDISQVSLAKITEDYLNFLKNSEIQPQELVDFLVVAAKLILIKSQILLPTLVFEQEEATELERQLKIYREFLVASKKIHKIILRRNFSFSREGPILEKTFVPPENVNKEILKNVFLKVLKNLEALIILPKETIKKVISLKEKIEFIKKLILEKSSLQFSFLTRKSSSKLETIIYFLAILELVKQRVIIFHQESTFEEITLTRC